MFLYRTRPLCLGSPVLWRARDDLISLLWLRDKRLFLPCEQGLIDIEMMGSDTCGECLILVWRQRVWGRSDSIWESSIVFATDLFYERHRLLVFSLHTLRYVTGGLYALELVIDGCELVALWHFWSWIFRTLQNGRGAKLSENGLLLVLGVVLSHFGEVLAAVWAAAGHFIDDINIDGRSESRFWV